MVKKIVFVVIVLNLICDLIEIIMPSKKLQGCTKSFVLVFMLFVICRYMFNL